MRRLNMFSPFSYVCLEANVTAASFVLNMRCEYWLISTQTHEHFFLHKFSRDISVSGMFCSWEKERDPLEPT